MNNYSKIFLIIIVTILALASAFVLGRIDFNKESNLAFNSTISLASSSKISQSSISSSTVSNSSFQSSINNLKVYTAEYYPKLKLKYDSNKWKLIDNSKDYTDMNQKAYTKGVKNLELNKNTSFLKVDVNPIHDYDGGGPLPCYKEYKELKNGSVRFKANFDQKEPPVWFYVSKPWVDNPRYNGYINNQNPGFNKFRQSQKESFGIEDIYIDKDVVACGERFIKFETKTILPAMFIDPSRSKNNTQAWMNLTIKGDPDETTLREIDQIVEDMEF